MISMHNFLLLVMCLTLQPNHLNAVPRMLDMKEASACTHVQPDLPLHILDLYLKVNHAVQRVVWGMGLHDNLYMGVMSIRYRYCCTHRTLARVVREAGALSH